MKEKKCVCVRERGSAPKKRVHSKKKCGEKKMCVLEREGASRAQCVCVKERARARERDRQRGREREREREGGGEGEGEKEREKERKTKKERKRAHLMNLNARCKLPRRRAVCSSAARANAALCALTDA
jgi:hypothetical protein